MSLLLLFILPFIYHSQSIFVINQPNASFNLQNRLSCYQFIDASMPSPKPILQAADDFTLTEDLANYSGLIFSFTTVRYKNSAFDPKALIISLMYNDDQLDAPGAVFFQKTLYSFKWDDSMLGQVTSLNVSIMNGDLSSLDNQTHFNLNNDTLMPPLKRLWVSFYAIGDRNYIVTPRSENNLYWMTTRDNETESFLGPSQIYFYIDSSNLLRKGMISWTNATIVESKRGMNSTTLNMAWTLLLFNNGTKNTGLFNDMNTMKIIGVVFACIITVFLVCCGLIVCCRIYKRRKAKEAEKKRTLNCLVQLDDLGEKNDEFKPKGAYFTTGSQYQQVQQNPLHHDKSPSSQEFQKF